jgi:hypothetical protein
VDLKESRLSWLVSIGQGLAWLVTAGGALMSALFIREALMDIMVWYGIRQLKVLRAAGQVGKELGMNSRITAIDFCAIFILACLAVWAIVEIDVYFRKGRAQGLLLKRVLTVSGIEAGIIAVSALLRMLIQS